MAQTCTICRHPQLDEIHDEIIRQVPFRNIGKHFNVGWQSVRKHKLNCMPKLLALANTEKQLAESENVSSLVGKWYKEMVELYDQAKAKEDIRLALYVADRALKCIELVQKQQMGPGGPGGVVINVTYLPCPKPGERDVTKK